ncbi:hypothetical protein B0H14DRAFT_2615511 [Mycena olivaceomarginata]|nr:hypothetical protein B0H14DRAFT_2615511 [Mycena olivaceomarginata]
MYRDSWQIVAQRLQMGNFCPDHFRPAIIETAGAGSESQISMWHQFAAQLNATKLPGMIGINAARALAKKQRKSCVMKVASPRKAVLEIRPSPTHEIAITELLI